MLEGRGTRGEGPRKKKANRREMSPATQTVQGWMCVSVKNPLRTVMTVKVAENMRKQKPMEEVVMPIEDKCSSRMLKEKPKEEKAAAEVVNIAVRKTAEEKRGRAGGRSEVRCSSAVLVNGPISGRESIPVEKMAAPQMQNGRRKPEEL